MEGGVGGDEAVVFCEDSLEPKALKIGKLSFTLSVIENSPLYNSVPNFPAFTEFFLKKSDPSSISLDMNLVLDPKLISVILLISYFKLVRPHDPNSIGWRSSPHFLHPNPSQRSGGSSRCSLTSTDMLRFPPPRAFSPT